MANAGKQPSAVRQALMEIRDLRERLQKAEADRSEPIAVVGLGLRFPGGATDPESYWALLRDGVDTIREIPADRWDVDAWYDEDPDRPGKMTVRHGGFLDGVDRFDPEFFNVSHREAATMDPQQRLLLEVAWESLERAGIAPDRLNGSRTGVFFGISNSDYLRQVFREIDEIDPYFATGNTFSVASGRLAFLLGLQGPAYSIDTACSSSLVAIHLASQSLRSRETDLVLAGGVSVVLTPELTINFSKARMMAPDGRCKTFDDRADGYVRGDGCGVVVLKRLADAQADGDPILAVLRGTATNQDGRSGGLTVPSGPAQERVIREALDNAQVAAADISYVEAHGTGTSLGDPIEVHALGNTLGLNRDQSEPLQIGSVKTNLGHLEAAAGVASFIKVVLGLNHKKIPPHLNFQTPSTKIDWGRYRIEVPSKLQDWLPARPDLPRLAGVSSFGFSGTNAHMILEEPPAPTVIAVADREQRSHRTILLSARSDDALREQASRLCGYLKQNPELDLIDVATSLGLGRAHLSRRLSLAVASNAELIQKLESWSGESDESVQVGRFEPGEEAPEIAFLFTGHGSQYPGMARDLYESSSVFREALDRCDEFSRQWVDRPLSEILFPAAGDEGLIHRTEYTQPATFAVEYALAELWRSWGVRPSYVTGHSLGEYVAACVAGVFSVEDGLKLVAARSRLFASLPDDGMMLSIVAGEERVREWIAPFSDRVAIAAINGPESTVISGLKDAVEAIAETIGESCPTRRVAVSQAAHSMHVEPLIEPFRKIAETVSYSAPKVPVASNLHGRMIHDETIAGAGYWADHFRKTVRFADGMAALASEGCSLFLELGPHATLSGMGQGCVDDDSATWCSSLHRDRPPWETMSESAGILWTRGVPLRVPAAVGRRARSQQPLPTYPFQRRRFWFGGAPSSATAQATTWENLIEEATSQSRQIPIDLQVASYPSKWNSLDRLADAYVDRTLEQWGVFATIGQELEIESWAKGLGIQPTYDKLLSLWFQRGAQRGQFEELSSGAFKVLRAADAEDPDAVIAELQEEFLDAPYFLDYLQTCGTQLAAVLSGETSPLDTLFPDGSTRIVDPMYREGPTARYFNNIVTSTVRRWVAGRSGSPVRVLEVGAGTGGTTSSILPELPPERTTYAYTDLSDYFFSLARERFPQYPFLRFGKLNIENDPVEQGYPEGAFDLIVAANVMHATKDLRSALENVRRLLAPGGRFLLYETTDHPHWFNVSLGLIEGWQRYDDDLRGQDPLLPAGRWMEVLERCGFERTAYFPEQGSPAERLCSHILLAGMQGEATAGPAIDLGNLPDAAASTSTVVADSAVSDADRFRALWAGAPEGDRLDLVIDHVATQIRRVLRRGEDSPVDARHRLTDLGVDSLMAVELRDRLRRSMGIERRLPATLVFDYPTVQAVAGYLVDTVLAVEGEGGVGSEAEGRSAKNKRTSAKIKQPPAASSEEVAEMSDEEVEAMLMKKLRKG